MTSNSGIIAPHKDCTLLLYLKRFTVFYFTSIWFLWKQLAAYSLATTLLLKKLLHNNTLYAWKVKLVVSPSPSERNAHLRTVLCFPSKSSLWATTTLSVVELTKSLLGNNYPKGILKGPEE